MLRSASGGSRRIRDRSPAIAAGCTRSGYTWGSVFANEAGGSSLAVDEHARERGLSTIAFAGPAPGRSASARLLDREAVLAYLFMIAGLAILLGSMAYPFFLVSITR